MTLPFVNLVPSPAVPRTASGNGDAIDLTGLFGPPTLGLTPMLLVQSDVTAVTGTSPSLTVTIQDSVDGVNWNTVVAFTAQTTVNRAVQRIGLTAASWPFNPRRIRAIWTITGTNPNFTFTVKCVLL